MPHTASLDFRNLGWAIVAVLGIVQFLAFLFYAASNYPETYEWHRHFISDLGRKTTSGGLDNTDNSNLFATSTMVLGASLLPFLLVFPSTFQRGRLFLRILAVVTVAGLIGIGQTPYDQFFVAHHVALGIWIVPMVIMAIALPFLLLMEHGFSITLFAFSGILLLATVAYASIGLHSGYVIMQKIVVFISLGWFVMLASTVAIVTKWTAPEREKILAEQAASYERKLRQSRK